MITRVRTGVKSTSLVARLWTCRWYMQAKPVHMLKIAVLVKPALSRTATTTVSADNKPCCVSVALAFTVVPEEPDVGTAGFCESSLEVRLWGRLPGIE